MPIPRTDPDIDEHFPNGGGGRPLPTGPVDPTLPDLARLPAPGQEEKLQLLQVGIGRPAVLAYGRHLVGGTVILQHEIGSTGKTFAAIALGEGEWDGIEALFINGLVVDHTDTSKYHFHPGLDGELGTESDPAVRNQKICSLWPAGLTPQTTFSRTAYLSVLVDPDFEAPQAGLQVIGIYRGLRVRIFDNTGTQTGYTYSTNPAWIALDLILRHAIIPRETLNKALTSAQKDRFDWQAFSDWADDCDVVTPQSTKRCESHIALVESTDLLRSLEQQLLLGRGFLAERNGKIAPFMDKARSSVVTLGRAHLWESQTSFSRKSTRDLPNKVTVRYRALASGTGSGTIDTVGTAVTGNGGSEFTKMYQPNEPCDLRDGAQQGEQRIVDSVASDTSMVLKTAFSVDQTGTKYGNPAQDFHAALRQAEDEAHQDAVGLVRDAEFDLGNAGPELAERRGNFLLARTLDLVERASFSLAWGQGRGLDLFFDDVLTAPQDLNLSSTREWEMLALRIEPDGSVVLNCQEYDPAIFSDAAQEEPTFSIPVSPRAPTGKFGSLIMGAKFVPDQERGNANVGEIEFVPLSGDSHTFWRLPSAAEFLIAKNATATSQFGQDSYTGRVYIIFSEQLCNSERSLAAGLDSHIIILRWNRSSSSFEYDNNTSWAAFTAQDTDICLFEVDRSGSGWTGKPTRWVGTQLLAHVRASEAITDAVEINQETPVEGRTGERILDILQRLTNLGLLTDADQILADGAAFGRIRIGALTGGDVDLSKAGVINRILDNIADTATRFAAVEAGANETETRTAAAIAGQGTLATLSAAAWASQVSGRPTELTDGRVAEVLLSGAGGGIIKSIRVPDAVFADKTAKTIADATVPGGNPPTGWNECGNQGIFLAEDIASVTYTMTLPTQSTSGTRGLTGNIGFAIHTGAAPATPQVSRSGNGSLTHNSPTVGDVTLTIYVEITTGSFRVFDGGGAAQDTLQDIISSGNYT